MFYGHIGLILVPEFTLNSFKQLQTNFLISNPKVSLSALQCVTGVATTPNIDTSHQFNCSWQQSYTTNIHNLKVKFHCPFQSIKSESQIPLTIQSIKIKKEIKENVWKSNKIFPRQALWLYPW